MFKHWLILSIGFIALAFPAKAQMKSGSEMQNYNATFGLPDKPDVSHYTISYLGCDSPGNILFPGEQPEFQFQIHNATNQQLTADGQAEMVPFGTKGIAGDIWMPTVFANGPKVSQPVHIDIPAGGLQVIKIKFDIPEQKGGYGIVLDFGTLGRQFATSCVRTFVPSDENAPFPKTMLDGYVGPEALERLGVHSIRQEWGFAPGDPEVMEQLDRLMKVYAAHHITVLLVLEAGEKSKQPLGYIGRRWLGDDDTTLDFVGDADRAWLPEQDDEFQKTVTDISLKYGWPHGPITACCIWNEPWEGISISGWQSDMIRYRTLYKRMALGIEAARKQGATVLAVGCDSSVNSWDKLFSDGSDDFLKWFDACTIHYQGIGAPSTYKKWLNRTGPQGRVQIWDTESWMANTDDRVPNAIAVDRAAGYDRNMGVFGGNITTPVYTTVKQAYGTDKEFKNYHAWPLAASVGAVQHFIGEREFNSFLFQKGLPWIFTFNGLKGNADDGTVVIAGDLGEVLGENSFPFRSVRGLSEPGLKAELKAKIDALPADSPDRAEMQKRYDAPGVLSGGLLTMPACNFAQVYDFYGNPLPLVDGKIQVPLDFRGYYMKTDGSPGSFAKLVEALKSARIDGYEPLNIIAHDALKPLSIGGTFTVTLGNILNRPVQGKLQVEIPGLQIDAPSDLSFAPFETKEIVLKATGPAHDDNAYPLHLVFNAGADGTATHDEVLRVNQIARRTVKVDGNLNDWKDVLPQSVKAKGSGGPSLTEAAWLPFKQFPTDLKAGVATAFMAYDDRYFYFAAKVASEHQDPGTFRFEHLDPDQFFYPEISYEINQDKKLDSMETNWSHANTSNALRLSAEDPNERDTKIWQSKGYAGLGFAIDAPQDKNSQVALYLASLPDGSSKDGIVVQMVDQTTGKILVRKQIENSPNGAYAVFTVKGRVHITVRGSGNNSVGVGGVFLDAGDGQSPASGSQDSLVRIDAQTQGAWPGKYGKEGSWLAGSPSKLPDSIKAGALVEHRWPKGVRRYSYRKDAVLPSGNYPNLDNVQLAFNVLPQADKITVSSTPGTMPNFVPGQDTDYEFALNKVADQYGGGTEIWRLRNPKMPVKNFYPREPASPEDGPVKSGKLVVLNEGNTRIVEAAIPWTEIPEVKAAAEAGRTVKFTYRVNDSKGVAMELAEDRSVSKTNPHTFHVEWAQHWGNEVEFGFEK